MEVTKHGHWVGGKPSPTWYTWKAMKARCYQPKHEQYPNYGGRGISVCPEWKESFAAFLADMGERPSKHTLDRKDVNGNYELSNCRWATRAQQSRNKRKK